MPLPLILGIAAGIATASGVGSGIHGGIKIKEAKDTMDTAKRIQGNAIRRFEQKKQSSTRLMDSLGLQELKILESFEEFSDLIERIQGRPEFKTFRKDGVELPKYDPAALKEVSAGAAALISGLGGATAGAAGGVAAGSATMSAVMALGTASTGTTIASLSGAAATNATMAALGGGAIAAGGGGIALGTAVLGATTLGAGLLVGGIIFNVTGNKLSEKADEAYSQAKKTERDSDNICSYLAKLEKYAGDFKKTLTSVEAAYRERVQILGHIINYERKTNWADFSERDRITTQNAVLLVGMLYKMCQVQLVLKDKDSDGQNTINIKAIMDIQMEADTLLNTVA